MANDRDHVLRVMRLLEAQGIVTWIFGGWAEELHGMIAPRDHGDVDLLYPANDFAVVDQFLQLDAIAEIEAKRLPHKRAFVFEGVMTEILLVEPDRTTVFWGRHRFTWPVDTFFHASSIRIASPDALMSYRHAHQRLQDASIDKRRDATGAC